MEIEVTYADALSPDDVRTLLSWRDWTNEDLVIDLSIGQLLKLYHASAKYISMEDWLADDPKAPAQYKRIAKRAA